MMMRGIFCSQVSVVELIARFTSVFDYTNRRCIINVSPYRNMRYSLLIIFCGCCLSCFAQQQSQGQQDSLKLSSGYKIVKKEAFLVTPDDLRRIAIVLERAQDKSPVRCAVVFGVIRADHRYYETTNIDEVFADPNIREKQINWVEVELRVTDPTKVADPREQTTLAYVELDATPPPQITIRVSASDRSWALSMADELEPQVERMLNKKSTPIWLLAIMFLSILVLLVRLRRRLREKTVLRFVVDMVAHPAVWGMTIGLLIASYKVWSQSDWFRMAFGPVYGFAWGDYDRVIADWSGVRTNIFWVVIVGLPLAIAANFVSSLWKLPSSKPEETPKRDHEPKATG